METNKLLNSATITNLFGINSEIYSEFIKDLKSQSFSEKKYESNFKNWKQTFKIIYGNDISSDLFLKHTYFILVLKILVESKIGLLKNLDSDEIYDNVLKSNPYNSKIFENEFFLWAKIKKSVFQKIFQSVNMLMLLRPPATPAGNLSALSIIIRNCHGFGLWLSKVSDNTAYED